jgi:hypothetical protein
MDIWKLLRGGIEGSINVHIFGKSGSEICPWIATSFIGNVMFWVILIYVIIV